MTEPENNPGNRISISHDKIDGEDYIVIRDSGNELIMKIQKTLWDGVEGVCGFTPEMRDSILTEARKMYG